MAKVSIRKVTKLELVGELPRDPNSEITITLQCWLVAIEKPIKQNLDDDDSEIYKLEVLNGTAKIG